MPLYFIKNNNSRVHRSETKALSPVNTSFYLSIEIIYSTHQRIDYPIFKQSLIVVLYLTSCELRVASCELRVASWIFILRVDILNHELIF